MHDLLDRYRRSINPPWNLRDYFNLVLTLALLLATPLLFLYLHQQTINSRAQSTQATVTANPTTIQSGNTITVSWSSLDGTTTSPTPTGNVGVGATNPITLSVSPSNFNFGDTLTVSWDNLTNGTTTDWIGFYAAENPDSSWVSSRYIGSCSTTAGTAPATSGTCNFPTSNWGLPNGYYQIRLFRGSGPLGTNNVRLAVSNIITNGPLPTATPTGNVGIGTTTPITQINKDSFLPSFIRKAYAQNSYNDYRLALHRVGDPASTLYSWQYLNCDKLAPPYNSIKSTGQCSYPIPLDVSPGTYEFLLYPGDTSVNAPIGTSNQVSITQSDSANVSLSATPTTFNLGDTFTVSWSGLNSPTTTDWIGFYQELNPDTSWNSGEYLGSCSSTAGATPATSGTCNFPVPQNLANGKYQIRLFRGPIGKTGVRLAASNILTLSSSVDPTPQLSCCGPNAVTAGTSVVPGWGGIANPTTTDWIGLYLPTDPDSAPRARYYTSYVSSTTASPCPSTPGDTSTLRYAGSCLFFIPANTPPDNYELRLFANDSFTKLATTKMSTPTGYISTFQVIAPTTTTILTPTPTGNVGIGTTTPIATATPTPIADTLGPSTTITNPLNGATVSGPVAISASATDPSGVAKVEFYIDGLLQNTDTTAPYGFSWDSTTLLNGGHSIIAKAYDTPGNIGSDAVSFTVANADVTSPSVPTNLSANASAYNQVNLSWTVSTDNVGVLGYWIVRNGTTIASSPTNIYSDTSVAGATSYTYQVIAYDSAGNNSAASTSASVTTPQTPDTQAPSAPTNLSASAVSTSQINLSWTASTDNVGVTGYDVYRNSAKVATVAGTSFGDAGLLASTTYSYFVKARDGAGNVSANSNTVSATTQAPATKGNVTGTVFSSAGGVVSGAKITFTQTRINYTYTTNSNGVYSIPNAQGGNWKFTFSATSQGYISQDVYITVLPGQTVIKNVTLVKKK